MKYMMRIMGRTRNKMLPRPPPCPPVACRMIAAVIASSQLSAFSSKAQIQTIKRIFRTPCFKFASDPFWPSLLLLHKLEERAETYSIEKSYTVPRTEAHSTCCIDSSSSKWATPTGLGLTWRPADGSRSH